MSTIDAIFKPLAVALIHGQIPMYIHQHHIHANGLGIPNVHEKLMNPRFFQLQFIFSPSISIYEGGQICFP